MLLSQTTSSQTSQQPTCTRSSTSNGQDLRLAPRQQWTGHQRECGFGRHEKL
jgi:hypothetical protein